MALTISALTNNAVVSDTFICKGVNDGSAAASSIFTGFKPRRVEVFNETDVIKFDYFDGMTAAYAFKLNGTGPTFTEITSVGVTLLDGTEASPATAATGNLRSSGAGFTLGTGILAASKTYWIVATR